MTRRDLKILLATSLLCNLAAFLSPAKAGTLYIDTGGAATNSCSRDVNAAALTGTGDGVVTGSTVQLTIGTNLSSVDATPGSATQDTIYLAQATNTNTKVFWITAKDDGLDQVTVSVAPTGITASNWAIGGRCVLTNASQEAALRAGDTAIFNNSPAGQAGALWTFRASGDSTSGFAKIVGKTGVRPVLNATSTNAAVIFNTLNNLWVENFEIDQDGATGSGITLSGNNNVVFNVKVSDAGSGGGISGGGYGKIMNSEITGSAGDGLALTGSAQVISGCYVHDNAGDGLEYSGTFNATGISVENSVFDTNAGRGILFSGSVTVYTNAMSLSGLTVYGNGNSGLEVADADMSIVLRNSIFDTNGDAAGEYNVEWTAGTAELLSFHAYNDFYQGGGSAGNVLNLTVNAQVSASEITTNPLLTSPAAGDFTLQSTSPAIALGYPGQLLGATGLGYLDLGAQQRPAVSTTGGGGIIGG